VLFFIWKEKLLLFFGASEVTLVYANEYMTIYALGTVFALLATGLNSFIICQGFSTVAMATVVIGAIFNIVLDPIFIFTLNMGVRGAAIATVISQAASCFFVVCFLLRKSTPVRITFGGYSKNIIRNIIKFGFSPFIIIATDSVLLIVMNITLKQYGGAQSDMLIAAATIMQSFLMIITMPLGGITGGTQPILSYNYGAQNTERIRQGIKTILLMALIFNTVMFLISRVVPQLFVGIFTRDPAVMELAVRAIGITTLGVIPLAVQYTLVDSFTAVGITRVSVALSLFRKTTYLLTTVLVPMWFGATAIFFAEPVADILGASLTTFVFWRVFGRAMQERESMPADSKLFE
ncbi:MAG: MATE family efflux transporter, partial [Angelakisella sp.]